MAIEYKIYDTSTILGVMEEREPVSSYFLDLLFREVVTFDDEYIDFEKVVSGRKLAPFVAPLAQGKPIYEKGSKVTRLKPAYLKPKDAITPAKMLKKQPGRLLTQPLSPQQNYDATVAAIALDHRESIERSWEWMAAEAIRTGAVTIASDDYPEHTVDFGRDPAHNVTLTGSAAWDDDSADPIEDMNDWIATVRRAKFGGLVNRATFGPDAWTVFYKNPEVRKQLDMFVRGTDGNFATGIVTGEYVQYMGRIGNIDLYVNTDYYEVNGSATPFVGAKEVILTSPAVRGVRAFGAILDKRAGLAAMPMFPKMWDQEDPSVTFLMTQSAPLMIPVNPNATLRATVLE